ncbi:hypothetical protein Golomagni_00304 [Golovinomyces magnicellulatus]|nr:hypothetical protein Golomagni_00304 [Golovinomyces magnicellulatus]
MLTLRSAHCSAFGLPNSPAFYRTPYASVPDSPASSRTTFYKRKADVDNVESPQFVSLESKRRLSGVRGPEIGGQQPILPKPVSRDVVPSISDLTLRKRGRPPKSDIELRQHANGPGELLSPATVVAQIGHMPSEEKMGPVSSHSSPVPSTETTPNQALISPRKVGTIFKKQGFSKRPSEGRFSLDQFIQLPKERPQSSKKSKFKAAHPTDSESASTKPNSPDSKDYVTEVQKSEKLTRAFLTGK